MEKIHQLPNPAGLEPSTWQLCILRSAQCLLLACWWVNTCVHTDTHSHTLTQKTDLTGARCGRDSGPCRLLRALLVPPPALIWGLVTSPLGDSQPLWGPRRKGKQIIFTSQKQTGSHNVISMIYAGRLVTEKIDLNKTISQLGRSEVLYRGVYKAVFRWPTWLMRTPGW